MRKKTRKISYKRKKEGETERKDVLAAVAMLLIPVCQRRNKNWGELTHLQLAAPASLLLPPLVDFSMSSCFVEEGFTSNFSRAL